MRVRVGIIGLGWFGDFHLEQLLKMDDVDVVALCTANQEKLGKAYQKIKSARCFRHHHEMFAEIQLDAVYVCVTPSRHEDIENIAAEKGIALYVEKPIGLDLQLVRKTTEIIRRSGIINSVGYQERYSAGVELVRDWLKNESPLLISGQWIDKMPEALWWRQQAYSGGQIIEQATHIIDMLRFLFGEMQVVCSSGVKGLNSAENYDVVNASKSILRLDSGELFNLDCGCYLEAGAESQIGFSLQGENSRLDYHWGKEVIITDNKGSKTYQLRESSHWLSSRAFIEAIKSTNQKLILSDYHDAYKTLKTTIEITEKMEVIEVTDKIAE